MRLVGLCEDYFNVDFYFLSNFGENFFASYNFAESEFIFSDLYWNANKNLCAKSLVALNFDGAVHLFYYLFDDPKAESGSVLLLSGLGELERRKHVGDDALVHTDPTVLDFYYQVALFLESLQNQDIVVAAFVL